VPASAAASAAGLVAALANGRPTQEGIYATGAAKRRLAEAVAGWRPDLAIVQMVRCGWAADRLSMTLPETPILFDAIDCMGLHYSRAAELSRFPLKAALSAESRRCRRRELELSERAALTTAVSARDLEALTAGLPGMVVPVTGGAEPDGSRAERDGRTVLLSGNLGYRPTVRAARWFARRVWPELKRRVPDARWVLAGARPAAELRRLGSLPGVEIHGDVDDLAAYLSRSTVAVAPMRGGSGVPIKILEAMAAGVPVVADRWSASGLEDPAGVAVAGTAGEWVDGLQRLMTDADARRDQSARGTDVWRTHYRPDRVRSKIRRAVEAAVERIR
jgi:glycosyltransferase involved in cell wall biosynthesis